MPCTNHQNAIFWPLIFHQNMHFVLETPSYNSCADTQNSSAWWTISVSLLLSAVRAETFPMQTQNLSIDVDNSDEFKGQSHRSRLPYCKTWFLEFLMGVDSLCYNRWYHLRSQDVMWRHDAIGHHTVMPLNVCMYMSVTGYFWQKSLQVGYSTAVHIDAQVFSWPCPYVFW